MFKTAVLMCAISAALAGCSSLYPAGLLAAARLDPLETAPGDLSVAISVPKQLRLRDGDATLYLAFDPSEAGSAPVASTVPLTIAQNVDAPRPPEEDELIYTFAFASDDAARLSAVQAKIKKLRAEGIEGVGTLSVTIEGGCVTGSELTNLPVSTWLRSSPTSEFVPLTRETDLLQVLSEEERAGLLTSIGPC